MFLLKHQRMGIKSIGKRSDGKKVYPNCFRTTEYVLNHTGLKKKIKELVNNDAEYICSNDGPSFIESLIFNEAIKYFFEETDNPSAGDILTLWERGYNSDPNFPVHVGIWLEREDYFFEQHNTEGRFEFDLLNNRITRYYGSKFYKKR